MPFTELEKTILLAFLSFTKGSTRKYLEEKFITSKFTMRKRKYVRISLKKLAKEGILKKHKKEKKYRFTKKGVGEASKILHEGAKLWRYR